MGKKKTRPSSLRVYKGGSRASGGALRIGEEFVGSARDVNATGAAVVLHGNGSVVFVRGLWPGEKARLKVQKVKPRYSEAVIVEMLETASARVDPPCPWHGSSLSDCGGCPWQFIAYPEQLRMKLQRVLSAFANCAEKDRIKPILASERTLSYRNRAQLKSDGKTLGFVANDQTNIVDVGTCLVLEEDLQSLLETLRHSLPNPSWAPQKKERWTTLDIDYDAGGGSRVSVNQRLPFKQVNSQQNDAMQAWLKNKLAALPKSGKLVELFCGSGNLTQLISAVGFKQIVAVEVVAEALSVLDELELPGVLTERRNLFDESGFEAFWRDHRDAEILVLDPPRDGLKLRTGLISKKSKLKQIIYISCDLATLIRDVNYFCQQGFSVTEVQPLDMFPQTPHVEVMVCLQRR